MPPVNQGSRSLMVTWVVVMAIVGVVTSVMAIYFYVDANKANTLLETQTKQYNDILAPGMLKGDLVTQLDAARKDPANNLDASLRLLDVAAAQRDRLAKLISGGEDEAKAVSTANAAITKAKEAGAAPAGDNMVATVDALVTQTNARKTEAENNKKDSEASKTKLLATIEATTKQIDSLTKAMEQIRQEKEAAMQQVQDISQKQAQAFGVTAGDLNKQFDAANAQINELNSQNAALGSQVQKLKTDIDALKQKLGEKRVDPAKAIVQQPDGHIQRVAGGGFCVIDIGKHEGVTKGLSFEVYDKGEGIPAPGDPSNDENLPVGKASIEVVEILGPSSSKCRIVRTGLGTVLSEGDLIVNLVFDKNTKYNFVVHGNFDLDRNGTATPADAEVIKRLITDWGANVVNEINVDTDFVVLGKEPAIPEKPAEMEPVAQKQYEDAMAALDTYQEISKKARDYRIPILNQNRFLYLVGYYGQSKQ